MSTDLTGIQTTALHGLLADQGIAAPDITALHTQYETLGGVWARKSVTVNNITSTVAIASFAGYDPTMGGAGTSDWSSVVAYAGGEYVRRSGAIYLSIAPGVNKDPVSEPTFWTLQTGTAYTVFTPSYSVTIPSWFKQSFLNVKVNGNLQNVNIDYVFSNNYHTIIFNNPPLTTDTVTVNLLPREIFYLLCEDFPAAIGVVPQAFVTSLGNGMLIDKSYARTVDMFASAGARKFANQLGQAQAWAQQSKTIATSAAAATFGSANNAAAGATGGFSKLAGNSDRNLQTVGTALANSGLLVNMDQPWISWSTLGLLALLDQKKSSYVGNIHVKVLGQSFQDPATGQQVTVTSSWVQSQVSASSADRPLASTVTDQALTQFVNRQLDAGDVAAVKKFLSATTTATTFADLMNYQLIWGSPGDANSAAGMVLAATSQTDLVTAISKTLASEMKVKPGATAAAVGASMQTMQSIPGAALNALTKPSTPAQFAAVTAYTGKGSGEHGAITCADALGETNYVVVLTQTIAALKQLSIQHLTDIHTDLTAVWYASHGFSDPPTDMVPADTTTVTLSDSSSGYVDWATLIVRVKNLTDSASQALKTQIQNIGKADLLQPYNVLAETHNTSTHIYATMPFSAAIGDRSTVVNFVSQLPGLGKNPTGFNAQLFIENCCQDNVTGQAIAGAMREGRNANLLAQANIDTDANSSSANPLPVSESAPGLVGGGQWPQPVDPYASKPSSSTGF